MEQERIIYILQGVKYFYFLKNFLLFEFTFNSKMNSNAEKYQIAKRA
jgi:hypothetical protein